MNIEQIFDTYYDRIYGFTLFRVQNPHDAEDIVSEVFVRAAKNLKRYNAEKAALSTWLFTIAVNEIKRHCSRRRDDLPLEAAENAPSRDNALERVLSGERVGAVANALARLDERQRSIVLLKYYGEMSNREIALALGLTETNVGTILSRSIKLLKNMPEMCDETSFAGYKDMKGGERGLGNA